jgi:signal transduction histidine kinase
MLRVEDDRMGIPVNELAAIFEVFVQGNTSLARPHGFWLSLISRCC